MFAARETIAELLRRAETHLVSHDVPNARRNAEWMLCHSLGMRMLDLYVQSRESLDTARVEAYWELVDRRASREPLQYILGTTEFMSLPFEVRPGVFVPRPETELLVERADLMLRPWPLHQPLDVLDLCCGSGIIGVALAHRIPNLSVTSVDLSPEACALTARNAELNGARERVTVVEANAIEYLERTPRRFAAILCNPPYIESGDLAGLPREVREHEPMLALDGGRDGLDFYRRIIPLFPDHLLARGTCAFEIGDTQGAAVSAMLRGAGFATTEVVKDYSGRDRVVIGG